MYESFYGLLAKPFQLRPDTHCLQVAAIEQSMLAMLSAEQS